MAHGCKISASIYLVYIPVVNCRLRGVHLFLLLSTMRASSSYLVCYNWEWKYFGCRTPFGVGVNPHIIRSGWTGLKCLALAKNATCSFSCCLLGTQYLDWTVSATLGVSSYLAFTLRFTFSRQQLILLCFCFIYYLVLCAYIFFLCHVYSCVLCCTK